MYHWKIIWLAEINQQLVEEVVLLFFLKRKRRQLLNNFNWQSNKLTLERSTLKTLTQEHSSVWDLTIRPWPQHAACQFKIANFVRKWRLMLILKSELTLASKCHFQYYSVIHSNQIYIKLPTFYIDTCYICEALALLRTSKCKHTGMVLQPG